MITQGNITFVIAILAFLFGVFNAVRKPQEDLDKKQAVGQVEVDAKASSLAQQVQWEKEATEKRFTDMGARIADAFLLAQNHTHTVDVKVDGLVNEIKAMSNNITRLSTIIDERIPKKP